MNRPFEYSDHDAWQSFSSISCSIFSELRKENPVLICSCRYIKFTKNNFFNAPAAFPAFSCTETTFPDADKFIVASFLGGGGIFSKCQTLILVSLLDRQVQDSTFSPTESARGWQVLNGETGSIIFRGSMQKNKKIALSPMFL